MDHLTDEMTDADTDADADDGCLRYTVTIISHGGEHSHLIAVVPAD